MNYYEKGWRSMSRASVSGVRSGRAGAGSVRRDRSSFLSRWFTCRGLALAIWLAFGLLAIVSTAANAGQNSLSWKDNSNGETGFRIQRGSMPVGTVVVAPDGTVPAGTCDAVTNWTQVTATPQNVTQYADLNRPENTGMIDCYRVSAIGATGDSAFSNTAGRVVPLAGPTNLIVTAALQLVGGGAGGSLISTPDGIDADRAGLYQATFPSGTSVTILATPKQNNSRLAGWGGACESAGTQPKCTLVLTANTSFSATFTK